MKKFFALTAALILLGSTSALADIAGSSHDFTGAAWNTTGEICIVCHTPHGANTSVANAPLWNHALSSTTYTPYDNTTGTQNSAASVPTGVSLLCLACHDGTINIDAFGGGSGSTPIPGADLSFDLSNDHPVGITYDAALVTADGGGLNNPATLGNNVTLFGGRVECSSCHDVHNGFAQPKLLVTSNAGSGLCLECHNK